MKQRIRLIYKNCEVCGERFPASIGSMERYCSVCWTGKYPLLSLQTYLM